MDRATVLTTVSGETTKDGDFPSHGVRAALQRLYFSNENIAPYNIPRTALCTPVRTRPNEHAPYQVTICKYADEQVLVLETCRGNRTFDSFYFDYSDAFYAVVIYFHATNSLINTRDAGHLVSVLRNNIYGYNFVFFKDKNLVIYDKQLKNIVKRVPFTLDPKFFLGFTSYNLNISTVYLKNSKQDTLTFQLASNGVMSSPKRETKVSISGSSFLQCTPKIVTGISQKNVYNPWIVYPNAPRSQSFFNLYDYKQFNGQVLSFIDVKLPNLICDFDNRNYVLFKYENT